MGSNRGECKDVHLSVDVVPRTSYQASLVISWSCWIEHDEAGLTGLSLPDQHGRAGLSLIDGYITMVI